MLGDINGHHPTWGRHAANRRGIEIIEVAESCDLTLLNDGSTTYTSGERQSSVDVSFVSTSIVSRLLWEVSDDPRGSDHHPITVRLDEAPTETSRRPRWLYKDADWATFQNTIIQRCEDSPPGSIDELTDHIFSAATLSIPRTSPTPGKKALHWWSASTKEAIKARRKALRAWKRLPSDHPNKASSLRSYQEARNTCRTVIREAKRASWEGFIDGVNSSQSISELWARVNAIGGKRRAKGIAIETGDTATRDPREVCNLLGDYFAGLSSIERYSPEFRRANNVSTHSIEEIRIPPDPRIESINKPFSMAELNFALAGTKGNSAGPDEIGYPLLKRLPPEIKLQFLQLINEVWKEETFPEAWRHSLVVPIPKANTPGHSVEHYRPISLTCCAGKVMERMANRRLVGYLTSEGLLDERQFAFRAGRGTNTYFGVLREALEDTIKSSHHAELITLDLSKAYNRAWMPGALEQLISWGLKGRILQYIKGFLKGRTFQVCLGNHRSATYREETGVPQGSVLAVTLFLIRMNGVFANLPGGIRIFVYADDIVLMVTGKTVGRIRIKLIQAANWVAKWAKGAGFQIAPSKSGYLHACRIPHPVSNRPVIVDKERVPRRRSLRILGVVFDRKLSFIPHFDAVRDSCKGRINILKSLAGKHANANRNSRLLVGKAIVFSRLTYGMEVTSLNWTSLSSKFAPVYQNTIRTVSGLLPSTPGASACAEIGELPFHLFIIKSICHRAISFSERTTGPIREGSLLVEANRLLEESAGQSLPLVSRVHWCGARCWSLPKPKIDHTIKRTFKAGSNPTAIRRTVAELLRTKYRDHIVRYSDGSRAQGKVGFGVTGPDITTCSRLPDQCSVFSAEAAAAFVAATTPADRPIVVLTDSASVVSGLENERAKHPWIQAILAYSPADTVFIWIPGHSGIPGNEEADHLAGSGRRMALYTNTVPAADLRLWVTNIIRQRWSQEWSNAGRGESRGFELQKIKADTNKWEDPTSHKEQKTISRLRTGHACFAYNMSGDGEFRIACTICRVHHSVEHAICVCPQYEDPRNRYNIPGSIREALKDDPTAVATVILFLKDTGLYNKV